MDNYFGFSEEGALLVLIITVVLTFIFLKKFFRLCSDVRAIREVLEHKWKDSLPPFEGPAADVRTTEADSVTNGDGKES